MPNDAGKERVLVNQQCDHCGAWTLTVTDDPQSYEVRYHCSTCSYRGFDSYADLFGVMSVPWGFAL